MANDADMQNATGTGRHRARRVALEILYRSDVAGDDPEMILAGLTEANDTMPPYASTLVQGVSGSMDDIDGEITTYLRDDWPIDRLGAVERAVLRMAVFELDADDVPDEVAIDEAVTLAKAYASDAAGKLVNGVLGARVRARREQT